MICGMIANSSFQGHNSFQKGVVKELNFEGLVITEVRVYPWCKKNQRGKTKIGMGGQKNQGKFFSWLNVAKIRNVHECLRAWSRGEFSVNLILKKVDRIDPPPHQN